MFLTRKKIILIFIFLNGILASCSLLKAREYPDAGFIPNPEVLVEMRERSPFNKGWVFDKEKFQELKSIYDKIVIQPVNTHFAELKIKNRYKNEDDAIDQIEAIQEIARYMREKFIAALQNAVVEQEPIPSALKPHVFPVDVPGPNTFELELAIVEIVPTDPVINTIGAAAGFFVPGGGLIRYAGTGSIAIEAIMRDSVTKEVYIMFKDRESDKAAPATIKDFQKYAHIRAIVDDWAEQFAELADSNSSHKVKDSLPFTLNPL
jgi:hypothetical protein